jgi:hypothetical protein
MLVFASIVGSWVAAFRPAAAEAPLAAPDTFYGDWTGVEIAAPGVLENDSDADGDPLTAILVSDVSFGSVTLNADGSLIYFPNLGFSGFDQFSYSVSDGTSTSAPVIAQIHINTAPVGGDDAYATAPDTTLVVGAPGVLENDTDADFDALTTSLSYSTSHGDLTLGADGSFTYSPEPGFQGVDGFAYQPADDWVLGNSASVTIEVGSPPVAPVAVEDVYTAEENVKLVVPAPGVLANDSDANGDQLYAAIATWPSNGDAVLGEDGALTYWPDPGFAGQDTFTYRAVDGLDVGSLGSEPVTVTIEVAEGNDAPVALDDSYSTDIDTILVVPAPGLLANDSDPDGDALSTTDDVIDGNFGVIDINPDGSFTFTPNQGFAGQEEFTYGITDGALTSGAKVTITVGDGNGSSDTPTPTATLTNDEPGDSPTPQPSATQTNDAPDETGTPTTTSEDEESSTGTIHSLPNTGTGSSLQNEDQK